MNPLQKQTEQCNFSTNDKDISHFGMWDVHSLAKNHLKAAGEPTLHHLNF